ncbi:hypothetical protein JYB88_07690 [Shewanella cyperi]|uniref:Uncharacterized protein n=1 Tax=Shewanella cyperi TaxID=2814292 RepID=A0A975AMI3_9GAMM|nr:hypothetical protein [Shewanella cyperi]QSX31487.1 hypothetical protein JYB88_07690 [Shewanella cyperi]
MKKFSYVCLGIAVSTSFCLNAAISTEALTVKHALINGKKCTATWSAESSKTGEVTEILAVREFDGKTQYQVFHSQDYPKMWTWDFRLNKIKCN